MPFNTREKENAWRKEWRKKPEVKEKEIARVTKHYNIKRKHIDDYKTSQGCKYCNENEACCLSFHHKNPKEKEYTISQMLSYSIKKIDIEIKKCIVVCHNCHRKIHGGVLKEKV